PARAGRELEAAQPLRALPPGEGLAAEDEVAPARVPLADRGVGGARRARVRPVPERDRLPRRVPGVAGGRHRRPIGPDVLAQREEVRVLVEDGAEEGVALRRLDLREGGIDVDVGGRAAAAPLGRDAVHAGQVDEQVGLADERRGAPRARPVLLAVDGVDEHPALAEAEPSEEIRRRGDAVRVRLAELVRPRVVGLCVVPGVLVEPRVVAARAEAEEIVSGLPGVAAAVVKAWSPGPGRTWADQPVSCTTAGFPQAR